MTGSSNVSLWPDGIVHYAFAKSLGKSERELILEALRSIESQSRVRFEPRTDQRDRITFRIEGSGHSAIGRIGGDQTVSLSRPITRSEVLHEVLHALGAHHEHTRPGRDEYVAIEEVNAIDERAAGFLRAIEPRPDVRAYDYGSVMHYPANAFAKAGKQTIVPRKPLPPGITLGKAESLSRGDVETLRLLYP